MNETEIVRRLEKAISLFEYALGKEQDVLELAVALAILDDLKDKLTNSL